MKKFLLILGMITCFATLTACGNQPADDQEFEPTVSAEEVQATAENYLLSLNAVIEADQQEAFEDDPVVSSAVASLESALSDLGDYESMGECTFNEDKDSLTITAEIKGSRRPGTFEMVFEKKQGQFALTSATVNVTFTKGEQMKKAGLNTLMGMGTVFAVLILISLLINLFVFIPKIQAAFSRKGKKADASVNNAVAQIEENEAAQDDDTELIAVIAAAIAASEGSASADNYVVRSLRRVR